jgi:hypothetical protein
MKPMRKRINYQVKNTKLSRNGQNGRKKEKGITESKRKKNKY